VAGAQGREPHTSVGANRFGAEGGLYRPTGGETRSKLAGVNRGGGCQGAARSRQHGRAGRQRRWTCGARLGRMQPVSLATGLWCASVATAVSSVG